MKSYKVSDYIAEFLEVNQVDSVFEVSGGMITHLLDSISLRGFTKIISCHHEQSCSFAADALGRIQGRRGVAFATSGPGATNLLTGIGSAFFDSSPCLFITGQVNVSELKGDRKIRQLGFQETDIVSMVKPIVKSAYQVINENDLVDALDDAFCLAISGRPGPVLIDIPMSIQRAVIQAHPPRRIVKEQSVVDRGKLSEFIENLKVSLRNSKKPLILVGGGIHQALELKRFRDFANKLSIPVVTSLMATDALEYSSPLRVGFIGSYGNRWANQAIGVSDFVLVLGSRLDIRQTGADVESFSGNKKIFHVDCEVGELQNRVVNSEVVCASITDFLDEVFNCDLQIDINQVSNWKEEISSLRLASPDVKELEGTIEGINPNMFMHELSRESDQVSTYISDVGNHQMWAAQSLELNSLQRHLTSGGMGAMGFALPAALGATFATDGGAVVVISGDGGIQLNIQELETISFHSLPIKIVIMNNESLGMIRQFQDSYFEGRHQSTKIGYSAPSFRDIGLAYKIDSKRIEHPEQIIEAVKWLYSDMTKPALLEVMIDSKANAYPKLAFGRPITEMEPLAKPLDMEGT
jgi:acetolactate synthase-1/2/3 large subunit